jgi:hypothetical protein
MRRSVVLDKNFLQGASRARVMELAQSHELLMPAALFYELLTTSAGVRRRCFAKLPQTENPVVLVDHIGQLISYEIEERHPSGKPSSHPTGGRFRFNPHLTDGDYELPDEAKSALHDQGQDVSDDLHRLIDLSETVPSLFPNLLGGTTARQHATLRETEATIARLEFVRDFYNQLSPSDMAPAGPPIVQDLDQWAHLRWLQVQMLFAVDLFVRYRGRLRLELTPGVLERLEHDVHDAQILALGVLEGAIATEEKKLLAWWSILCPEGEVHGTAV